MFSERIEVGLPAFVLALLTAQGAFADKHVEPEKILAGTDQRIAHIFQAESGKPLLRAKKKPPLKPGRTPYVRAYSYSILSFAAKCLYLNESLDEANAALVENAQYYLDDPASVHDRDSFHWHADGVMRLVEMYGPGGSTHPGRMTAETERLVLEPIWLYASQAWIGKADYKQSGTWHHYGSENHHAMDFTVNWHFAKLAKDRPDYRNRKYLDGSTAAQQYKAWNAYFLNYTRERASKGICAEMRSDGYNATLMRCIYNFHDFGNEPVREAARKFLDLYFAYWAEEQIDGLMGGGASRIKGANAFKQKRSHGNAALAWLYFNIGSPTELNGHLVNALLSSYRPHPLIAEIAIDAAGRGTYEIIQRTQGLGKTSYSFPVATAKKEPTKLNRDGGGIIRYSYCTPEFILGTPMVEARPLSDWAAISAQARWQGAVFAGEGDPRIVPIVRPKDNRVAMNQFWSVQRKGSLLTQKLKHHKGGAEMMVWMSQAGLGTPVEEDGVVFVEAPGAYAAIRVVQGGYVWKDSIGDLVAEDGGIRKIAPGRIMFLKNEYAPLLLEVMAKSETKSFDAFKSKVKATRPVMKDGLVRYKSIYGDTLTLDTTFKKTPTINGKPVNYAPEKLFNSPFLNSTYDSGVVSISKGKREHVLDFNTPAKN